VAIRYQQYEQTGEAIPSSGDAKHLLPFQRRRQIRREQFEYWHLPTRWTHVSGLGWLPDLATLSYLPGANGVQGDTMRPGGPRKLTAARNGMSGKGGILIRRDNPQTGGDYVVRHQTTAGIYHHTDRWARFRVVGGRLRESVDEEGRNAWLLGLVEAGEIGAMPHEVLEDKLEVLEGRRAKYEQTTSLNPDFVGRKLAAIDARLAEMREDWDRQFGAAEAPVVKPPSKRGKK